MNRSSTNPRIVTIVRWVARIWSILILAGALVVVLTPDPYVVKPVPLTDWLELSFYWLAILGLLVAWRWEGLGGTVAIVGVLGHDLAFRIIRGYWFLELVPSALLEFLFVVPAILFLACWMLSRDKSGFAGPPWKPVS